MSQQKNTSAPRFGIALEHGNAHTEDHRLWSRRDFMTRMGLGSLAAGFMLGSTPVSAFAHHPLALAGANETDRVLVLIQLAGGNDGLNTIIPVTNDEYYRVRPGIAIPKNETLSLNTDFGMHPALAELHNYWNDGSLGVIHSVGYPDPNLSHFRSTDIWSSASDSDEYLNTGWVGRTLDIQDPDFETAPPEHPLAVQLGSASSLLFQGPVGPMGMSIINENIFNRLARGGQLYDEADVPSSSYGDELAYVRGIANGSYQYAGAIKEAIDAGSNSVEYPAGTFSRNLANVARMIKGGLQSGIYLVSLGGFDTHANQLPRHQNLLSILGGTLKAFQDDLARSGHDDRVLTMTLSEFGRRVEQNGSFGCDHGTSAPLFMMGKYVNGGLYGNAPDLLNLNNQGNLAFDTDFRSVYATVLQEWLGFDSAAVSTILGQSFGTIPIINEGTSTSTQTPQQPRTLTLGQNFPNPVIDRMTIPLGLPEAQDVRITIHDVRGREVETLVQGTLPAGRHAIPVDCHGYAAGMYFYTLQTQAQSQTRGFTVIR